MHDFLSQNVLESQFHIYMVLVEAYGAEVGLTSFIVLVQAKPRLLPINFSVLAENRETHKKIKKQKIKKHPTLILCCKL